MLKRISGSQDEGRHATFELVEAVEGASLLSILEDCSDAPCEASDDEAHDGARVKGWTSQCSGRLPCRGRTPTRCGCDCVDLDTDREHCGQCDNACAADEICTAGECECFGDTSTDCGGDCVNTDTDREHCGQCDNACDAGEVCSEGACAGECGGATSTACADSCANTDTHRNHCGQCEARCPAAQVCTDGACAFDPECGADAPTPCGEVCVDTDTDTEHCGQCDEACPAGNECIDGVCGLDGARTLRVKNPGNLWEELRYVFVCGVNESSDNDQSVLAFTGRKGEGNDWGDRWRDNRQYGTLWSFWNHDYYSCPSGIGNVATDESFAGWKGVDRPWAEDHRGTYELYIR